MRSEAQLDAPFPSTLRSLTLVLLLAAAPRLAAGMSAGGGEGGFGQTCDALTICPETSLDGVMIPSCPMGMHYVGAPQITVVDPALRAESPRNPLYQIRTSDSGVPSAAASSDPTTYAPGELVTLHLRVTKRFTESRRAASGVAGMFACWPGLGKVGEGFTQICAFSTDCCAVDDSAKFLYEPKDLDKCYHRAPHCMKPHPWAPQPVGREIQAWETSKYMGLLMYAEDETGQKIGGWEIIPETPPDYWTPPDPGCDGKSLMHSDVRLKPFHTIFHWRAPAVPLGLGKKVVFRVLIKHGYTNGGAFFWPLAPAMPGGMQSKYDLALTEVEPRGDKPGWFVSEMGGTSCATVCASNNNRECDESVLQSAASDPFALETAIRSTIACKLPIMPSCEAGAPAVASSGVGTCWYNDALSGRCPGTTAQATCSSSTSTKMRRICPCKKRGRRRRRLDDNVATTPAHQSPFREPSVVSAAAPRRAISSSVVLAFTSVLLALRGSVRSRTVLTLAFMWGVAEHLPTTSAHNWLQKPSSRSILVSNRPSGVAKQGSSPHVQLNPGESFPMEWRIGHSSHKKMTYFAIIRAKDEAKLALADRYALQDYLNRAPSTAAMARHNITCGDHRRPECKECKTGKCGGECKIIAGKCELDLTKAYRNANAAYPEGRYMDTQMYDRRFVSTESSPRVCKKNQGAAQAIKHGVEIPQGDPRNIRRPAPFNCKDPHTKILQTDRHVSGKDKKRYGKKNHCRKNPKYCGPLPENKRKVCVECGTIKQYTYYEKHSKNDARAGYNSSKYPWLISVSAYGVFGTHPAQDISFDIAQIMIPPSLGPGNYVMKYSWSSYSDIVDIAVLPPKPNGSLGIATPQHTEAGDFHRYAWFDNSASTEWIRIDHCQYLRRTLGSWKGGANLSTSAAYVQKTYPDKPLNTYTEIKTQAACIAIPPPAKVSSLNYTDQQALALCQKRAILVGAEGINVVPMDPPPKVKLSFDDPGNVAAYYNGDSASVNIVSGINIPWGTGNCQRKYFANEPAGTKICYPLSVYGTRDNAQDRFQVEEEDPEDEVWYSTCYNMAKKRNFDTPCGTQCQPNMVKKWRFGDQCISCADATRNSIYTNVPHWELADSSNCHACWAPLSDAPPFRPAPADAPENGWISPDGGMSMTWTRTVGTSTSVTFVVTCAACTTESGWLAIGPSPHSGMIGTHAVRWQFSGTGGVNGSAAAVNEVRISQKSAAVEVVAPGHLKGIMTTSKFGKAKTLTFSAAQIGNHTFPGHGNQKWAWAYRTDGGFIQHGASLNDRGVVELSFTLDPAPVPAPTKPPVFDPADEVHNDNEQEAEPTAAPTLGPSIHAPDVSRPRVEAKVTLIGCSVQSCADGSMLRKSFVSVLAQKLALEDKDVIVIETHAMLALEDKDVHAAARRRLYQESEAGQSTSIEFAVIGYAPTTPTELLRAIALFLGNPNATGFEFCLQDLLFGTKYQNIRTVVQDKPVIAMSAQATAGGEGSADSGAAAALISLSVVTLLGVVAIVGVLAAVTVAVVVIQRKRQNASIKAAAKLQPQDQQMGGIVAVSTFNPYSAAMKQVEMRDMIGFAPPADEPPPPMMDSDDGGGNDDTCTFAPSVDLLPPPEIVMKGRSNPNRAPKIPKGTRLPVAEL